MYQTKFKSVPEVQKKYSIGKIIQLHWLARSHSHFIARNKIGFVYSYGPKINSSAQNYIKKKLGR